MNCQKNYFFLALAFFSTSVWALTDQGSGYTGTYEIRTCQDMVDFANIVRGEGFNQNTKANAKVMNAINMTCTSEYPKIGRQNDTYTGTFDGQNYPIKGLKLTSGDQNVGLFAAIGEGAYLKNFVVQDVEITGTVSRPEGTGDVGSIGGLVGWQNGGTIEGCYVSGTVRGTGNENGVGGIVGNSYAGVIKDCYSHVNVRAEGPKSYAGGIVGYAFHPCALWTDNIGVTVYSSVFDGTVYTEQSSSFAGGIAGNSGERDPLQSDMEVNQMCNVNVNTWDHDYFVNLFYDANSADVGVGTTKRGYNGSASYPNNNGGSENNFTKTNVPETFDMDSRHTICLLNEGTWNAETETCENQKSDVWSGGEGGISNGAGVFEDGVAKYLITFDPNGGKFPSDAVTSKQLEMGAAINADNITNPYRRFYTFKGWATSKDASSPTSLGNVTGAMTFYAVWEAATTETLKVYFNKVVGNVTVLDSITVTVNVPADTSEAKQIAAINNAFAAMDPAVVVAKVGGNEDSIYTHDSWARNKDASGKPVFDASGNVTYEPTFTAVLANTLVAQYGSGTGDSILVKVPAADSEADRIAKIMDAIASHDPEINVEKTGGSSDSVYTYSGWQIKKDGSGTAITDGSGNVIYEPTFDVEVKKETIVARFGTDDDDTVLVEVHVTDNDETRFDKIEAALASHDPAITPKKDSTETTVYEYNGTWTVNGDGEYEPQFDESAREYTVTLNVSAAVAETFDKTMEYAYSASGTTSLPAANTVPLTEAASAEGFAFEGWFSDEALTSGITEIAAGTTGAQTVYGKVAKDSTFEYEIDGEKKTVTVEVVYGETAEQIITKIVAALDGVEPTKEQTATTDYTYAGTWEVVGGKIVPKFDESAREYTVTLNVPDGATVIPAMTKYAAGTAATLPSANLDGWTFSGWVDGSGTPVTQIAADATGDKAYTAVFTKNITVVYGEGAGDKLTVEIEQDDSAAEIVEKIEAALASHDPAITPKKDSTETTVYEYNGTWTVNGDGEYEPQFNSSARKYEVTLNVPTGATVSPALTEYAAGSATDLPTASLDGWKFSGWVDGNGTSVSQIAADAIGDKSYTAVFTKDITVVYGEGAGDKLTVEIEQDDSEAEIIAKIEAALEAENITPTKESSATTDYTYNGEWVQNTSGEYVAQFDESAREYTVTLNVPDGATVIPAMTKYAAGTAATLPSANLDGWTFSGWVDGSGTPVTQIAADATGDKSYTAVFTKDITVVYGDGTEDKLTVTIEQDDSAAEIVEKIEAALEAENITPTKESSATTDYTYNGEWVQNTSGEYVAQFDESAREYTVTLNVPDGATVIPAMTKYAVGTATDLPTASLDGWKFSGWVDGNGTSVSQIAADAIGDKSYTAVFTKDITVVYGDGTEDKLTVTIEQDDSETEIVEKIEAAIDAAGVVPTRAEDSEYTYSFNGEWAKTDDGYRAEFDSKPKFIEVVVGDDTVKVVVPGDTTSGEGGKVVIDIKVVVDGDTINVPVTEGDVLDSAARAALDSIPTKPDTEDSTYEFKGWKPVKDSTGENVLDENGNAIYEPEFEAEVKKETIVVSTDDGKGGTIEIVINVTDSDDDIEKKIEQAFKDNGIPLPTKTDEGEIVFNFDKFVYDNEKGVYVPDFIAKTIFGLTFVMPKKGKLTTDMNSYVFGEKTTLPGAFIEGADEWEFKGWYTKRYGLGDRVKMMLETDCGDKVFYPLFQKTVAYNANGVFGEAEVIYDDNSEKNVTRALERVVPEDYEEDGETYSFSEWVLEDGVYVAKFSVITGIHSVSAPRFSVAVLDRTFAISGARNGAKIAVYDIRGQLRATGVVMNGTQLLELGAPGSYIVRVDNQSTRVNIR